MVSKARSKRVRSALTEFGKEYGDACVRRASTLTPVVYLKTGVRGLDDYTLYGTGVPRSRFTEIHGPFSSGKTTLAYKLIQQTQKDYPDGTVCFIDAEGRMNRKWAQTCGVDLDKLHVVDFSSGEDLLDKVSSLVSLGVELVVIDSVAGIIPKKLGDLKSLEDFGADKNFARSALLTLFCDRLAGGFHVQGTKRYGRLVHSPTAVVFVNHWVDKPKLQRWGPIPDGSIGGKGLRFHCALRLGVTKRACKKDDHGLLAIKVRKSIETPPDRDALFHIGFHSGEMFSTSDWMVKLFMDKGLLEKAGRKFSIVKGPKVLVGLQGRPEDLMDYLYRNPKRMEAMLKRTM